MIYDCGIIGGGPAGLNAALGLGRARRKTVLFDHGQPRNAVTRKSHGFLTRDGAPPSQIRELARQEIAGYPSVLYKADEVIQAEKIATHFHLTTRSGVTYAVRKVILATGFREVLPQIDGVGRFYGKTLFNCPYCDGWELRDQPLVQISEGTNVFEFAKLLFNWSKDLVVCTNGRGSLSERQQGVLESKGILVRRQPIHALVGQGDRLEAVCFADGTSVPRQGGFITPAAVQRAGFAERFGCVRSETGGIVTDAFGRTSVWGVYAAGDTSSNGPSQLIIAAGEGSRAAIGVNTDLTDEEF